MSEPVTPEQPIGSPSVSSQHRLLPLAGAILGCLGVAGLSGMLVWQWQAGSAADEALREMGAEQERLVSSLVGLDERLNRQAEQLEQLTGQLERLSGRLAAVDISDADNAVVGLQRILIRQERDYRDFLTALQRSMLALDRMIPRSGAWWQELEENLQEGLALSEAREDYVFSLRE